MAMIHEQTSGVALELPDHWRTKVGPNDSIAIFAQAADSEIADATVAVVVEEPSAGCRELGVYIKTQRALLNENFHPQGITCLGRRQYDRGGCVVEIAVHSLAVENSVLSQFQIFAFNEGIMTAITVTVPLVFMEEGWDISHEIIQTLNPATRLYRHTPYLEKHNDPGK